MTRKTAQIIRANRGLDNERGSALIMTLFILMALLYFAVLVIDMTRIEQLERVLQATVDAASLAGATELVISGKPSDERWKNSKRAALGSLRKQLGGRSFVLPDVTIPTNHVGPADSCESTGDYRSQTYDNNSVAITIERGHYVEGTGQFRSLEDDSACNASGDPVPNAVQVTVSIQDLPVFFSNQFGFTARSFGPITRSAIGTFVD